MARKVTAPDGTAWKVGREWSPWRLELRGDGAPDLPDLPGLDGPDELAAFFLVIVLVILLVVAVILGWFLIALAVELLVLLVGAIVGIIGRVVLRKPWTVRARARSGDAEHVWRIRGWRDSSARIDEAAGALERGLPLPATD